MTRLRSEWVNHSGCNSLEWQNEFDSEEFWLTLIPKNKGKSSQHRPSESRGRYDFKVSYLNLRLWF